MMRGKERDGEVYLSLVQRLDTKMLFLFVSLRLSENKQTNNNTINCGNNTYVISVYNTVIEFSFSSFFYNVNRVSTRET